MCREGYADLQPVLDAYTVQEAPYVKPVTYTVEPAQFAEV